MSLSCYIELALRRALLPWVPDGEQRNPYSTMGTSHDDSSITRI